MPRFVVLRHNAPRGLHWDLMLEAAGALRTWALSAEPRCGATVAAEVLADHRLAYLDYEGPVAGDRGTVRRFDAGDYEVLEPCGDVPRIRLAGEALTCVAELHADPSDAQRCTFAFLPS